MSTPYEILAPAGLTAYLAAANTTEPNVDATPPAATWFKLGTNGTENYDEGGLSVKQGQSIKTFTGLGSTAATKAWRESEQQEVGFTMYDLTAEQYAKALNGVSVTTVVAAAGVPGSKWIPLLQGYEVTLFALLLRGNVSPYGDSMNLQYWMPMVYQAESPEPTSKKAEPMGLKLNWMNLKDLTNGFGKFRPQTAPGL